LLKVDPTRFVSSVRENRAQYIALLAKAARLRALAEGKPFVPPPEALKDDPKTVEEERRLYESRAWSWTARSRHRPPAAGPEAAGTQRGPPRRAQAAQAYDLTAKELR
jgi:adhesin transport system membrane fusion protein